MKSSKKSTASTTIDGFLRLAKVLPVTLALYRKRADEFLAWRRSLRMYGSSEIVLDTQMSRYLESLLNRFLHISQGRYVLQGYLFLNPVSG